MNDAKGGSDSGASGKWSSTTQELVHHNTHREEVAATIQPSFTCRLFRREVVWRSEDHTGASARRFFCRGLLKFRNAKVQ